MAVLLGPLYTEDEFRVTLNSISELAAQNTPNNYIMILSFLAVGSNLAIDGIRHYTHSFLPFILFGICIGLAGAFPHKPINAGVEYNILVHNTHNILAVISGFAITIGFIWQGVLSKTTIGKIICFYLAAACLIFPLLMLYISDYQGLFQRAMYAQVFIWLWFNFPKKFPDNNPGRNV